jgi:hypothetical protein
MKRGIGRYRRNRWGVVAAWAMWAAVGMVRAEGVTFIVTSDLHYGTTREFRGATADAQAVNRAMIERMNALPEVALPGAEGKVGPIDFVVITGDITNRGEKTAPAAAVTWGQFQEDYLGRENAGSRTGGRLKLRGRDGAAVPVYLVAGNHDISNAIGYPDVPTDATAVVEISNRMRGTSWVVDGSRPLEYAGREVNYAVDRAGVHMMFVSMWPDRGNQAWMEEDLKKVRGTMPVFVFAHAPVDPGEAKYFRDQSLPTRYTVDATGVIPFTVGAGGDYASTAAAKAELTGWLARHKQVKAYFFGHDNYQEFTTLTPDVAAPGATVGLFRADSPMKGSASQKDEKKLSFNVFTMDTEAWTLIAREYLWNAGAGGEWGASKTISVAADERGGRSIPGGE